VNSEELALAALGWIESVAVTDGDGVCWGETPGSPEEDPTLYQGAAGIVLTLVEAHAHLGDRRWAELAERGMSGLARSLDACYAPGDAGLYGGASGMAFALQAAADWADPAVAALGRAAAARAMEGVRSGFDGERWDGFTDLLIGNAGIALAALAMGDVELAETAVVPFLRTAEVTAYGQTWETRRGEARRLHHMSHGTLGVAYALAAVGAAAGRADLIDAALAGTADVTARNEAGPDGFLVQYSEPEVPHPRRERISYGWCHGPAGDAQLFRLLARLDAGGRAAEWTELSDRCWTTLTTCGLPAPLRPGFWDNSGHCCGTAGVLALALDRAAEGQDGLAFADVLVADIARRATVDATGARWSNLEHRDSPPELEPRTGWAMGSAGVIRELLRHARLTDGRDPAYAVQWPDQPVASAR